MRRLPFLTAILVLCAAAAASAQGVTLDHSGYVLNAVDQPLSGATPMKFALYDAASGGTLVWTGEAAGGAPCPVVATAGYYAVRLGGGAAGCGTGLTSAHLPASAARWLEITVDGVVMSPRQSLSPAYAARVSADAQDLKAALASVGTINTGTNPVDWTQLKSVPASLADGSDDIGAVAPGGGLSLASGAYALATDGASLGKVSAGALANDGTKITASLPLHGTFFGSGASLTNLGSGLVGATGDTLNQTLSNLAAGTGWTLGGTTLTNTNTGNVGIGTTAPSAKLTVAGTIRSTTGGFVFPDGTTQATAAVGVLQNQLCPQDQYLRGFDASGNRICGTRPTDRVPEARPDRLRRTPWRHETNGRDGYVSGERAG